MVWLEIDRILPKIKMRNVRNESNGSKVGNNFTNKVVQNNHWTCIIDIPIETWMINEDRSQHTYQIVT